MGVLGSEDLPRRRKREGWERTAQLETRESPDLWWRGRLGVSDHKEEAKATSAKGKGRGRQPWVFLDGQQMLSG